MAATVVRVQRNVSLDPEHEMFLQLDADEQGHRNVSRSLQRMLERLAEARYGVRDWRRVVRELSAELDDREEVAS